MTTPINVLAFTGSLRQKSYNRSALFAARDLAPEGVSVAVYELADIPPFNEDFETHPPEPVRDFKHRIAAADALLVSTPEYNHSIPGVLKNAIDWASRPAATTPLNGKPLGIMGCTTGPWGTARAQMALRLIAVSVNMHTLNRPFVQIAQAATKFDADGRLTDEPTRQQIHTLMQALAAWARKLK